MRCRKVLVRYNETGERRAAGENARARFDAPVAPRLAEPEVRRPA